MFSQIYMDEVARITKSIDYELIEDIVDELIEIRGNNGRLFVLGIGGSAGNASHMVNDLRKLCGIEAHAPTDNVSEFSARINDEGFDYSFSSHLECMNLCHWDGIFILSVGGGNKEKNISVPLCNAIDYAIQQSVPVFGIVGKKDCYATQNSDKVIVVPEVEPKRVTPHSEAFQAVIWHCIVSHPKLQVRPTTW